MVDEPKDELKGYDPKPEDARGKPKETIDMVGQILAKAPTVEKARTDDVLKAFTKENPTTIFSGNIDTASIISKAIADRLSAEGELESAKNQEERDRRMDGSKKNIPPSR